MISRIVFYGISHAIINCANASRGLSATADLVIFSPDLQFVTVSSRIAADFEIESQSNDCIQDESSSIPQ